MADEDFDEDFDDEDYDDEDGPVVSHDVGGASGKVP
jgi:hypothetical protein